MNMDLARKMLREALENGLQLHGISANGRPAISFDYDHPGAEMARRRFLATDGLVRELLRAAMIDECINRGLPEQLDFDHHIMPIAAAAVQSNAIH